MVRFGVVAAIAQQKHKTLAAPGLADDGVELGIVGLRAAVHHGGQEQVAAGVHDGGEFRIAVFDVATVVPAAARVVGRAVPRLQARRIHRRRSGRAAATRPARPRDQAEASGFGQRRLKEPLGAPFFRSRPSA